MTDWYSDPFADQDEGKPNGKANNHAKLNGHGNGHDTRLWSESLEPILCEHLEPVPITSIPPRPWAYGKFLLFGYATVLAAVDGGGKGATAIAIALSMITGRPLLGEQVWRTGPAVILTYEDDKVEWQRRIAAACQHYVLDYEAICSEIYFISRPRGRITLAAHSAINGRTLIFPDHAEIVELLRAINPVLFIIDPLNHAHALEDGNSNAMIAQLAAEIGRIAAETDVAVLVLHHLRKGATGHADDMMGALMLRATFRATRILRRMTKEEADPQKIPTTELWRYNRIASGKENYSPPPDLSTWYRFESIELGNGTELYPDGDSVQVVALWDPPDAFEGLTKSKIAEILAAFRYGPGNGEFYSPHATATHKATDVIANIAGKTPAEAARILQIWTKNQVVRHANYYSPKRKRSVSRIDVEDGKAIEILGSLWRPSKNGRAV